MTLEDRITEIVNKLDNLDKLRGTGYWNESQNNLWHAYYKLYGQLMEERWRLADEARRND